MLMQTPRLAGFETAQPVPATAGSPSIAATLWSIPGAWRQALAAHRRYDCLRSRGTPHDVALRQALDHATEETRSTKPSAGQHQPRPRAATPRCRHGHGHAHGRGAPLSRRERVEIGLMMYGSGS